MPFGIDDMLIGAGISAGTGLISKLFSGDSERSLALKRLKDKINAIQQLSRAQINTDLNSIDNAAKSVMTHSLNEAALSTAGRQNATASILSSLAPSLAQARVQREEQLNDYNRNLPLQKLQMEAGIDSQLDNDTPQQDAMSVIGLGLQGAMMSAMGKEPVKDEKRREPFDSRTIPEMDTSMNNYSMNNSGRDLPLADTAFIPEPDKLSYADTSSLIPSLYGAKKLKKKKGNY